MGYVFFPTPVLWLCFHPIRWNLHFPSSPDRRGEAWLRGRCNACNIGVVTAWIVGTFDEIGAGLTYSFYSWGFLRFRYLKLFGEIGRTPPTFDELDIQISEIFRRHLWSKKLHIFQIIMFGIYVKMLGCTLNCVDGIIQPGTPPVLDKEILPIRFLK